MKELLQLTEVGAHGNTMSLICSVLHCISDAVAPSNNANHPMLQVLQGRVAGRNSEDAAQIKAGLLDLQGQWKSFENSAKQVRRAARAATCRRAATKHIH